MSLFRTFTLQVERKQTNGSYIDGRWVDGLPEPPFTIQCSWQPANAKELEVFEEGLRTREIYRGYTSTLLLTADQSDQGVPDVIIKDSIRYTIIRVEDWQNGLINHYKFFASRIKEPNSK